MSNLQEVTRTLVIERVFPHPPEKIWRALTEGPLMEEWLMKNDFQPVVGHRLSQEVRNSSAVSFQESLRAQCPRKCMYTLVEVCFPIPHGTSSTTTPHCLQSTRRMQ